MNSPWAALLEMLLVFGVVIGAALWSLVRLRREQARDRAAQARHDEDEDEDEA